MALIPLVVTEPASSDLTRRPFARIRNITLAVATAFSIWLCSLSFPIAPSDSLDGSWQLVLGYAWEHGFIFGRDIVYTYGPWGWLTTLYFHPATYEPRVIWEVLEKAIAAVMLVWLAGNLSVLRRIALVAAALLLLPLFQDTLPMLLVAGLVLWCTGAESRSPASLTAIGALLGFLSLQKFTYLLLAACGSGGLIALWLFRRDTRSLVWFAGAEVAALIAAWTAAGQPLLMLPLFLQRTGWIASGYPYAMYWDESATVFRFGVLAGVLYLALVWWRASRERVIVALVLTGCGLLSWKHGFTRADGHTFGFFLCMTFAGIAAPALSRVVSPVRTGLSWALVAAALAGSIAAVPEIMTNVGPLLRLHWTENAHTLLNLRSHRTQLEQSLAAQQSAHRLPAVQQAVGHSSVDQFGYEQAVLLFNRLNYRPRPVFQSFHAYSGPLARLNEASYLGDAAPEFTLTRLQTIDGRFPALDDAALLPRLVTDHDLVVAENGFLLLRHRRTPATLDGTMFASGRLRYGIEEHTFAGRDGRAIWAKIDAPLSWIGWLRAFFYKPPEVRLVVQDSDGAENSFRLVVPAARAGFLLSPVLADTNALERLLTHRSGVATRRVRVEIDPNEARYFLRRARFEFATLPALDFHAGAEMSPPTP